MSPRMLTQTALLLALALALHQVERLLPFSLLPYPGVKLGLGNLVTLLTLFLLRPYHALLFAVLRNLLTAWFAGLSGLVFALTGALLAFAVMSLLAWSIPRDISLPALSAAGAITHNIGQLIVAAWLSQTPAIFSYLPVLCISGTLSGVAIGLAARFLLRAMKDSKRYSLHEHLLPLLD